LVTIDGIELAGTQGQKLDTHVQLLSPVFSGVGRAQPMPGHSMGTLCLQVSYPGHTQLSAACSTEMQKQLGGSGGCCPRKFWNFWAS